jgi:hypothetical protein
MGPTLPDAEGGGNQAACSRVHRMLPVIIIVVVMIPLLVLAWVRVRRR